MKKHFQEERLESHGMLLKKLLMNIFQKQTKDKKRRFKKGTFKSSNTKPIKTK